MRKDLEEQLAQRLGKRVGKVPRRLRAILEDCEQLEHSRRLAVARAEQSAAQAEAEEIFHRLRDNDPQLVLAAIDAAFEDNGCPSVPIDVDGAEATVLMLFDHPSEMPERRPAVTPGGKPTLKRVTKTDAAEFYCHAMASNVLATLREGFAVAPGLRSMKVIVLRREPVYEGASFTRLQPIYAGLFRRSMVEALNWRAVYPPDVIDAIPGRLLVRRGRTRALTPLDLAFEDGLGEVVAQAEKALAGAGRSA